jgi:hypothetical protein
MDQVFAKVTYVDQVLLQSVRRSADEKFGKKNSYVKNLWVLKEYRKRGGRTKFKGKKPSSKTIQKQVKASQELDIFDDVWDNIDEFEQ